MAWNDLCNEGGIEVGIICGSGLQGLSATLEEPRTIAFSDIRDFPQGTKIKVAWYCN